MTTKKTIQLDAAELTILRNAIPVHLDEQLSDERDADDRIRVAKRLAKRIEKARPGDFRVTDEEASELSEACDSYLYWEVSDPQDRDSGFVFWDPEEDEPGSKMARSDRDPNYVEECRAVQELADRFSALS
jgi:hypothetical protein